MRARFWLAGTNVARIFVDTSWLNLFVQASLLPAFLLRLSLLRTIGLRSCFRTCMLEDPGICHMAIYRYMWISTIQTVNLACLGASGNHKEAKAPLTSLLLLDHIS